MEKIEEMLLKTNIAPETLLYKISQDIVQKAQRNQIQEARKRKVKLEIMEVEIQQLRTTQESANTEHKVEMANIIEHRQEIQTNRSLLIDRIEEQHKSHLINKYLNKADKCTPYHYHRNMNTKMRSQITMIRTDEGKLLIDRQKLMIMYTNSSKKNSS
jgi:hypothetical protein